MLGGTVSKITFIAFWAVWVPLVAFAVITFVPLVKGIFKAVKELFVSVADMPFTVTVAVLSVTVPDTFIVGVFTLELFIGEVIAIESITVG